MIRVISRFTIPLAVFGSSTWSQMATLYPFPDQFCNIAVNSMVRDTGKGDPVVPALRARGEHDIQFACNQLGIAVEGLVKIPDPEEEDGIRVLCLQFLVLAHDRGETLAWVIPALLVRVRSRVPWCEEMVAFGSDNTHLIDPAWPYERCLYAYQKRSGSDTASATSP